MYKKARQKQMPQPANMGFSTKVESLCWMSGPVLSSLKLTASTPKITMISTPISFFSSWIMICKLKG
ncbi:hypothetical protein Csa_008801 [Cucumis sativus]|nr:hypothetical protein Csa_008801 [Cucumis sativus]